MYTVRVRNCVAMLFDHLATVDEASFVKLLGSDSGTSAAAAATAPSTSAGPSSK